MKTLEQKIMARVRRIYYLRKLAGPTALKLYGLTAATAGLFSAVSVVNVIANAPSPLAPTHFLSFLTTAFKHTELFVQLLVAGLCVLAVLLVRDFFQTLRDAGRHLTFRH